MNDLAELVRLLEGYECENTGFKVIKASGSSRGAYWKLLVEGYSKGAEVFITEDKISIRTLLERIEGTSMYKTKDWEVIEVSKCGKNLYNLAVRSFREREKIEEDSKEGN